jgi:hypothetical protein
MIQKSELTQVPVEQRVPGQWYGVADDLIGQLTTIVCWAGNGLDTYGVTWEYWYKVPELIIPSGSKSEQIAELEKILAELKQS